MAGANGWLAADLAGAGFTGLPDMLTGTFGRISGSGLDAQVALDRLGARFEITRNYFKRYACCRYNRAAIQALEELLSEEGIEPGAIEQIRVETYAAAATMNDRAPAGRLAAKFSSRMLWPPGWLGGMRPGRLP